jgi:hypothetical protein
LQTQFIGVADLGAVELAPRAIARCADVHLLFPCSALLSIFHRPARAAGRNESVDRRVSSSKESVTSPRRAGSRSLLYREAANAGPLSIRVARPPLLQTQARSPMCLRRAGPLWQPSWLRCRTASSALDARADSPPPLEPRS